MKTSSSDALARRNAAREASGRFGIQPRTLPECSPLPAPAAIDLSSLTAGGSIRLAPGVHGIPGLGVVHAGLAGEYTVLTMHHPEGTDLNDLYNWDDGSKDVNARLDAVAVAEEILGVTEPAPGAPADRVDVDHGQFTYTYCFTADRDMRLDVEDLKAWAGEFISLADPAHRDAIAEAVTERYESR